MSTRKRRLCLQVSSINRVLRTQAARKEQEAVQTEMYEKMRAAVAYNANGECSSASITQSRRTLLQHIVTDDA